MEYIITPPKSWDTRIDSDLKLDVYEMILRQYDSSDILFKIIKKDGSIKELNKSQCVSLANSLASKINNLLPANSDKSNQLRVMAIIGASEESAIFMLTSLLIGAHHCICFEDLSKDSIYKRLHIFRPDIVLCRRPLQEKVQSAIFQSEDNVPLLVIDFSEKDQSSRIDLCNSSSSYYVNSNLFTLFTSGSTGLPKAITHGVKQYLDYAKYTTNHFFGIHKGSVMFTAVDAGWINGHTYAFYGPLLLGAISVINEKPLFLSMPNLLARYLSELQPDCFYTSVTQLRLLMSIIPHGQMLEDLSETVGNLERIGSCGEPLANNVGEWAIEFFNPKRKSIVNTYFQTETGGVLVAPRDEDIPPSDYSCVGKPSPELGMVIASDILDESEIWEEGLDPNELLVCNRWDGIFKEVISDKESKYFTKSGYFRLCDVGYFDEKGYLFIGGRSDDVINVSGHRISSSEIESVSICVNDVKEACAVAISDSICGNRVVLFFSSKARDPHSIRSIKSDLQRIITEKLTHYHLPKEIYHFDDLPKTKSGKIMRRIMRDLAENKSIDQSSDYSTLANKEDFLESTRKYVEGI